MAAAGPATGSGRTVALDEWWHRMNGKSSHAHDWAPFSRWFAVDDLMGLRGAPVQIVANEAECADVARFLDLPAVRSLAAEFLVRPEGRMIRVTGQVRARVTQVCVVSLEPFDGDVAEPVDVRFCDDPAIIAAAQEAIAGNEAEWDDPPDPVEDGRIDLGSLACEHLSLGLDPHPRKPGVSLDDALPPGRTLADEERSSPFSVLRRLKRGDRES